MEHFSKTSEKRERNSPKFRRRKVINPGDKVVLRDPRLTAAGGRTPWKKPLTEPLLVEAVEGNGNRLTLRTPDPGKLIENVHIDEVVHVPPDTEEFRAQAALASGRG